MIDFDTPSSNFIIHLPDDNSTNLDSDWFNYKEVSIKGQNFLFLSLLNDNLMSSKELSDKIQIDIQDFIPLGPQNSSKFDQKFYITGYNQKDFKFNEYKAFLRQISSNIKVYDNISVIEVNTENCQEDIDCLSTFLPFLYPYLSFTSYLPKNRIRIFITNRNGYLRTVTKSDILSLLNWENLINQIYFNSNKSIADIVLNEEGEKYYKRLFQDKVITLDNYIFTICKFANISKINKYKSLELKVQSFPSNFTLEKAYQFFSDYQHIYRIQIFNESDMKTSVLIQFTSQRCYKRLLEQTNLRYQSKILTIKPNHETITKSDNNNEEDSSELIIRSENRQISPLKTRNFIDDEGNDDTFLADKQLNTKNEVKNITSHHSSRDFIDDADEEDNHKLILNITSSSCDEFSVSNSFEVESEVTKSEVVERGINLHLVKDINNGNQNRRNHLFISDSYSENDDNDEEDISLNSGNNRKYFSSSRFANDSILSKSGNIEFDKSSFKSANKAPFVQDVAESISKTNKSKNDRLYISDEENDFDDVDENLKDKDNSMKCDAKNVIKKFVVLEREIDDVGSYSYSEAYTEYGSCSDSD